MKPLSKLIVFITGAFLSHECWNEWKHFFEHRGYKCMAPAWPHKEGTPEQLRNGQENATIPSIRLNTLVDYFAAIAQDLPEKPILIGHSLGGLIIQLLLQREVGTAGVSIHSFAPGGIGSKISLLRTLWEAMGFFTPSGTTYLISFRKWKRMIANGLTCAEQKQLYYRYAVPESKLVIRDIFNTRARIDFLKAHPPLLLLSGGQDKLIPASVNYHNYRNYQKGNSITEYRIFNERNHLVFGQCTWREDADFVLHWLENLM